jgi:hypothetical protein
MTLILAALILAVPLAWLALEIRLFRLGYVVRPGGAKPKKPAKATPPERTDYA